MARSKRFKYEAVVILEVTAEEGRGTCLHTAELEYDHNLHVDGWQTASGEYTEEGLNALLFAFCTGVTAVIHNAGQRHDMDTAALYRKAIAIMDQQFATAVNVAKYPIERPINERLK